MLEELWASDYYYYKSLEYELRVYNADKADKEIERLRKALEELRELGKYCSGDVYEVASQALKGE